MVTNPNISLQQHFVELSREFELLDTSSSNLTLELQTLISKAKKAREQVEQSSPAVKDEKIRAFVGELGKLVENGIKPEVGKAKERALREYQTGITTSFLSDRNVKIVGISTSSDVWLIIQELKGEIDGLDILDRYPDGVTQQQGLAILLHIAQALKALHDQGLVHRDIKPANIRVDNRLESAYLVDAGIVSKAGSVPEGATLEARIQYTGDTTQLAPSAVPTPVRHPTHHYQTTRLGTMQYSPLEQIQGTQPIHPSADIYALGATMFHLLSGQDLAQIGALALPDETQRQALIADTLDQKGITHGLKDILATMLAQDPTIRYQSATELLKAAEAVSSPYDQLAMRDGYDLASLQRCADLAEVQQFLLEAFLPPDPSRIRGIFDLYHKIAPPLLAATQLDRQDLSRILPKLRSAVQTQADFQEKINQARIDYDVELPGTIGDEVRRQNADPDLYNAGRSWALHLWEKYTRLAGDDPKEGLRQLGIVVKNKSSGRDVSMHSNYEFALRDPRISIAYKQDLLALQIHGTDYIPTADLYSSLKSRIERHIQPNQTSYNITGPIDIALLLAEAHRRYLRYFHNSSQVAQTFGHIASAGERYFDDHEQFVSLLSTKQNLGGISIDKVRALIDQISLRHTIPPEEIPLVASSSAAYWRISVAPAVDTLRVIPITTHLASSYTARRIQMGLKFFDEIYQYLDLVATHSTQVKDAIVDELKPMLLEIKALVDIKLVSLSQNTQDPGPPPPVPVQPTSNVIGRISKKEQQRYKAQRESLNSWNEQNGYYQEYLQAVQDINDKLNKI
jgi:serine/threonine protein kinase